MSDEERPAKTRRVISVSCTKHGGTPGYANLVVRRLGDKIEFDPHADQCCVLLLTEAEASELHAWVGELLGSKR